MNDEVNNVRSIFEDADPVEWIKRARAANRQKRFRENSADYKESRKAYDAQRKNRSGKSVLKKKRSGGHFVAIDAEGLNIGERFKRGKDEYQNQRTCLWMAGGVQGIPNISMVNTDTGFTSEQIMAWLLSLPSHFNNAIKAYTGESCIEEQPIFVSFGFGYDVGQIVKDLPYEKRWELNAGKPWSQRHNKDFIGDLRSYPVLYKGFALYYIPGKMVTLFKLTNPDKPFIEHTDGTKELNFNGRITIYDTFGFFQQKFTLALGGFPKALSKEEYDIVEKNKAKRGKFTAGDIEEIKLYTSLELKGLVNMMNTIRPSLREAIEGKPIEIDQWYGAGAIATASLRLFLGDDAKEHIGNMEQYSLEDWNDDNSHCKAVRHAYFGARIDLVKQGNYSGPLYENDVASAYPAKAADLPSIKGGTWQVIKCPTREQIFNASALSMFEVRTHNYATDLPFYALPYRTKTGSIMFPCHVWGYYMRDHVIAAYKHYDRFSELGRLADYSRYRGAPEIEVVRAWIFHPASDVKPLKWIRELFDYRTKLIKADKKDARGQVIKLDINAVYGKFAQRIGRRGKPPKFGSLWYAAAITAGTQRQLMEAALTKPDAIIAFATDGIYTTEPLDIHIPAEKTLGEWEMQKGEGGSFIQSGVYVVHLLDKEGKVEVKAKSRGFTPDNADKKEGEDYKDVLNRTLRESIPDKWANGEDEYSFAYQQYITVGLSVAHRNNSDLIGCWKLSPRSLGLNSMSNKRIVPGEAKNKANMALTKGEQKLRESRAKKLIALQVKHIIGPIELSGPSIPEWLDERTKIERMEVVDNENVIAGLS